MTKHKTVSREEWVAARRALLAKEKHYTELGDELSQARRALPWVRVDKEYSFETSAGRKSLSELFAGRNQLVVYHFMFAPEWEAGCKSCSFWADSFDGLDAHLNARDVSFTAISRAPLSKLQAFAKRMGWSFSWVSSAHNDFNYDYHASFRPEDVAAGKLEYNYAPSTMKMSDLTGVSVFYKDESGQIFHTYSAYARGVEVLNTVYRILDLVPKGRDEAGLSHTMAWVRLHDEYAAE